MVNGQFPRHLWGDKVVQEVGKAVVRLAELDLQQPQVVALLPQPLLHPRLLGDVNRQGQHRAAEFEHRLDVQVEIPPQPVGGGAIDFGDGKDLVWVAWQVTQVIFDANQFATLLGILRIIRLSTLCFLQPLTTS